MPRFYWNLHLLIISLINLKLVSSNTLHTASACVSKKFSTLKFNASNSFDVPLRKNGNWCGEDDFLLIQSDDIQLLTVADGVGSWVNYGVNPKIFTRELLKCINGTFKTLDKNIIFEHDKRSKTFLLNIVDKAYYDVQEKNFIRFGSCTVVSLSLNLKTLHLNTYVLGDSGFMIIRRGKIFYRSTDLMHSFNMPYQLTFRYEGSNIPRDGFTRPFKLRTGDIVVIGSDGLFDNLFDEAILYYVNIETKYLTTHIQKGYSEAARRIAKKLTLEAKRNGETTSNIITPFSQEVNSLGIDLEFYSGKNDDTTVVVAIVS